MTSTMLLSPRAFAAALLVLILAGGSAVVGAADRHGSAWVSVQVTADPFAGHVEPDVAVNPRHLSNVLGACQFEIGTRQRLPGTFFSTDGGRSWHDNGLLPLPAGYEQGADTSVAFARDGTGYVAALLSHGGNGYASRVSRGGIFLWRTRNGGRSFSRPIPVYVGPGFQDHPWLVVRNTPHGAILNLAWTNRSGLVFTRSQPGSAVFTRPRLLVAGGAASAPVLVTGSGADLELFFQELQFPRRGGKLEPLPAKLAVIASSDGGTTFGPAQTIGNATIAAGSTGQQPPPLLAAAADDARPVSALAIAAEDPRSGHPTIELWQRDGATGHWLGPIRPVTGAAAALTQEEPRLVYAKGRLFLSYFTISRRGTIREQLTSAPERARGFTPQPVPALPFRANGFIGDYQALAVSGRKVYLLWNDGHGGKLEIEAARVADR